MNIPSGKSDKDERPIMNLKSVITGLNLIALSLLLFCGGCRYDPSAANMVPENLSTAKRYLGTCEVTVLGVENRRIGKTVCEFREALIKSLEKTGIFTGVVDTGGDFSLVVSVHGMNFYGKTGSREWIMSSRWTLSHTATADMIWQELIVHYNDATVAGYTLASAPEALARDTITEAIQGMSK